jgi:hypothetical protein
MQVQHRRGLTTQFAPVSSLNPGENVDRFKGKKKYCIAKSVNLESPQYFRRTLAEEEFF